MSSGSSIPPNDSAWPRAVLTIIGITMLCWLGWHSRSDLSQVFASASPAGIAAATIGGVALNVVFGLQFDALLAKQGGSHARRRRVAAYLLSQPGKYVPGKIWSAMMQSFALRGESGISTITLANLELAVIAVVQSTGLGAACLLRQHPAWATAALAASMLVTILVARLPSGWIIARISPRMQHWLRLPGLPFRPEPGGYQTQLQLTLAALACSFQASWCLVAATQPAIAPDQIMPLLACLYLGFAASVLVVIVPAGIGVREAAVVGLGSMIAPEIEPTLIISVALLIRCWQLLVDVVSLCLGAFLLRTRPN